MSSTSPLEELRSVVLYSDLVFLLSVAATGLVVYEHLITLGLEVQQIWNRSISGATILFILTRYLTLINRLFVAISFSALPSLESCEIITWIQSAITSVLVVVMSATAAVRVYALWGRNIRLATLVMVTGIFPALANLFFRSASTAYILPAQLYSCQLVPTAMSASTYMQLAIATRVIAIFSDGLVVVLTWIKTYHVFSLARKSKIRTNYSALILRDGTSYFLAVCLMNLLGIVYIAHSGANIVNDGIVTLSSLLMDRFLLNLRNQGRTADSVYMIDSTLISTINFASGMTHSMGGILMADHPTIVDHGQEEDAAGEDFVVVISGPRDVEYADVKRHSLEKMTL